MLVVPLHSCPNGPVVSIICRLTFLSLYESFSMVLICKDVEMLGGVTDEVPKSLIHSKVLVLCLHTKENTQIE